MRKLRWWFAIATVAVCLVPYYSTAIAIIVLVPSLLVSAANSGKIWFARAYGEDAYQGLILSVAAKSSLSHALTPLIFVGGFMATIGFVLLLLCPDPAKDWGYWFGIGFL